MLARKAENVHIPNTGVLTGRRVRVRLQDIWNAFSQGFKNSIGILLLFVCFISTQLVLTEKATNTGYEAVKVKKQVERISKENEVLRLDVAMLRSPARIQSIAEGSLGMVQPTEVVYSSAKAKAVEKTADTTRQFRE